MTAQRLTKVQRDVLGRLRDGWKLYDAWPAYRLEKRGEASRHVRCQTVDSLWARKIIYPCPDDGSWEAA